MKFLHAFQSSAGRTKSWSWSTLPLIVAVSGCTTLGLDEIVGSAANLEKPVQASRDVVSGRQYASLVREADWDAPAIANQNKSGNGAGPPTRERADDVLSDQDDLPHTQLAQFAVPQAAPGEQAPAAPLVGQLKFEYVLGTEAEVEYQKNVDLDRELSDDILIGAPTIFGSITYRPTDWLESRVEVTFEKVIDIRNNNRTELPDGTIQARDRNKASLLIDQAFAKISPSAVPAALTLGRRNFEDQRLWLYDTALDGAIVTLKPGDFNIEASMTRENLVDLDLLTSAATSRINNYIVYAEYRGIEDNRLAGYWILLDDRAGIDGKPQFYGVRAIGRPSDPFNYWVDLGFTGGQDENGQDLSGWGFDIGGTHRFLNLPLQPSISLGYAFGSGDRDPNDNKNDEFRQTGLQSNEVRFGGVTQFIEYGETLAPELSNIGIITAGASARLAPGIFVDLVYHNYRFDEIAQEVRGSNLTALTNQIAGRESKDIGNEIDLILGFRDLFGVRGLGFEVRAGMFFPGDAFDRDNGSGGIEDADKAISALFVSFF